MNNRDFLIFHIFHQYSIKIRNEKGMKLIGLDLLLNKIGSKVLKIGGRSLVCYTSVRSVTRILHLHLQFLIFAAN